MADQARINVLIDVVDVALKRATKELDELIAKKDIKINLQAPGLSQLSTLGTSLRSFNNDAAKVSESLRGINKEANTLIGTLNKFSQIRSNQVNISSLFKRLDSDLEQAQVSTRTRLQNLTNTFKEQFQELSDVANNPEVSGSGRKRASKLVSRLKESYKNDVKEIKEASDAYIAEIKTIKARELASTISAFEQVRVSGAQAAPLSSVPSLLQIAGANRFRGARQAARSASVQTAATIAGLFQEAGLGSTTFSGSLAEAERLVNDYKAIKSNLSRIQSSQTARGFVNTGSLEETRLALGVANRPLQQGLLDKIKNIKLFDPSVIADKGRLNAQLSKLLQEKALLASQIKQAFGTSDFEAGEKLVSQYGSLNKKIATQKKQVATFDSRLKEARVRALNASGPEELGSIAESFRVPVSQLSRGGNFDVRRITSNRETLVQLGFAAAFGGPLPLLGGIVGGATRLGTTGSILGSTFVEAGSRLLAAPIEALSSRVAEFKEAGLAFQRSILGITAIRQANTQLSFAGGGPINFQNNPALLPSALRFQSAQAEKLQLLARQKLLPLGVGGQTEATFVQGIVSALSQRGIESTPEQTAKISELVAGAIAAQRPSLFDNTQQLLKDLQDVIGGGPAAQRTVLSQLVKPALPGLQRATSAEDIISALSPLSAFAKVATTLENPIVALNKFNSAIDNLNTQVGNKLLKQLVPALSKFGDILSDPKTIRAGEEFGDSLGKILASLTRTSGEAVKFVSALETSFIKPVERLLPLLGQLAIAIGAISLASGRFISFAPLAAIAQGAIGFGKGFGGIKDDIIDARQLGGQNLGQKARSSVGGFLGGPTRGLATRVLPIALAASAFFALDQGITDQQETINEAAQQRFLETQNRFQEERSPEGSLRSLLDKSGLKAGFEAFPKSLRETPFSQARFLDQIGQNEALKNDTFGQQFLFRSRLANRRSLDAFYNDINFDPSTLEGRRGLAQASSKQAGSYLAAIKQNSDDLRQQISKETGQEAVNQRLSSIRSQRKSLVEELKREQEVGAASEQDRAQFSQLTRLGLPIEGSKLIGGLLTSLGGKTEESLTTDVVSSQQRAQALEENIKKLNKQIESASLGTDIPESVKLLQDQINQNAKDEADAKKQVLASARDELAVARDFSSLISQTFNRTGPIGAYAGAVSDLNRLFEEEAKILATINKGGGEASRLELEANRAKQSQARLNAILAEGELLPNPTEGRSLRSLGAQGLATDFRQTKAAFNIDKIDKRLAELGFTPGQAGPLPSDAAGQEISSLLEARKSQNQVISESGNDLTDQVNKEYDARKSLVQTLEHAGDVQFDLGKKYNSVSRELDQLDIALKNQIKAQKEYEDSTRLRSLGAKGQQLAAAKRFLAAGGSEIDLPFNIRSLVGPGSESIQADLEKELALEEANKVSRLTDPFRLLEEEQDQKKLNQNSIYATQDSIDRARRQRDLQLPREDRNSQLDTAQKLIQLSQALGEDTPQGKALQAIVPGLINVIEKSYTTADLPGPNGLTAPGQQQIGEGPGYIVKDPGKPQQIPSPPTKEEIFEKWKKKYGITIGTNSEPPKGIKADYEPPLPIEGKDATPILGGLIGSSGTPGGGLIIQPSTKPKSSGAIKLPGLGIGPDGMPILTESGGSLDLTKTTADSSIIGGGGLIDSPTDSTGSLLDPDKFFGDKEKFFKEGLSETKIASAAGADAKASEQETKDLLKNISNSLEVIINLIPPENTIAAATKTGLEQAFGG